MFWKPAGLLRRLRPSLEEMDWLTTKQSLTTKIKMLCPQMQVVVLSEQFERPLVDESRALGLDFDEKAWVRCVLLRCADKHWVYARTVIPHFNSDNPWHNLKDLGDKPLGEILFTQTNLQRSDFEFCAQPLQDWPYLLENSHYANGKLRSFARRSQFSKQHAPLLLTEVFLPAIFEEPAQ